MLEHTKRQVHKWNFLKHALSRYVYNRILLIFLLKLKWPKNKSELWVVRQVYLEIFCFNEYGDNDETMILYQWNELQWRHSNHEHLVTLKCGLVHWTGAFNVFTLTKCYTCNTVHHKRSLYFLVNEKKNVHKNVKCSRFECPYCKDIKSL